MAGPNKARDVLGNVPSDKAFVTRDGLVLGSLGDLALALKSMSATTYDHHVTGDRNDFCNWVLEVIGDDYLAEELLDATHAKQAAKLVSDRIAQLTAQPKEVAEKPMSAPKVVAPLQPKKVAKKLVKPKKEKPIKKEVSKKHLQAKQPKKVPIRQVQQAPKLKKPKIVAKKIQPKPKITIKPTKMAQTKPKAKRNATAKRVKQLTREQVNKIEEHSYLKIKYPHRKMYEQSIIQKHEHINHHIKEFMFGAIVGFAVALILLRMLRII